MSWDRFKRAIYCRLINDGDQIYLPGCRPDTIIITNIGQGRHIDQFLEAQGKRLQAIYHCLNLHRFEISNLDHCDLFAIWYLRFGISITNYHLNGCTNSLRTPKINPGSSPMPRRCAWEWKCRPLNCRWLPCHRGLRPWGRSRDHVAN